MCIIYEMPLVYSHWHISFHSLYLDLPQSFRLLLVYYFYSHRFCHLKYGFTTPLQWYLYPVVGDGHVSSSRPESLANGSIATSRVSQARQIKRVVT